MTPTRMSLRFSLISALMFGLVALPAAARQTTDFSPERTGGNTGIGVSMGDVNGVSLKLWTNPSSAFQVRLGSLSSLNSAGLIATYAHHFRPIEVPDQTFSLPIYIGAGVRFGVASSGATYMDGGIATLVGMSVLVPGLPVDLYFELRPTFLLYDPALGTGGSTLQAGFLIDSGLGAHFYDCRPRLATGETRCVSPVNGVTAHHGGRGVEWVACGPIGAVSGFLLDFRPQRGYICAIVQLKTRCRSQTGTPNPMQETRTLHHSPRAPRCWTHAFTGRRSREGML